MIDYISPNFELQCAIDDRDIIHIEQVITRERDFLNAVCLGEDQTPLAYACMLGYADVVRFLIEKGADVNVRMGKDGETAIYWAVEENKLEVIRLLVEFGARTKIYSYQGDTPADCIPSEDDYDGDFESLEIMSEYLQECFDREDSWYDNG
jgi:ankyrin repeat protein